MTEAQKEDDTDYCSRPAGLRLCETGLASSFNRVDDSTYALSNPVGNLLEKERYAEGCVCVGGGIGREKRGGVVQHEMLWVRQNLVARSRIFQLSVMYSIKSTRLHMHTHTHTHTHTHVYLSRIWRCMSSKFSLI